MNYPLSFYGASAVNIYGGGTVNVFPLQNDPLNLTSLTPRVNPKPVCPQDCMPLC